MNRIYDNEYPLCRLFGEFKDVPISVHDAHGLMQLNNANKDEEPT